MCRSIEAPGARVKCVVKRSKIGSFDRRKKDCTVLYLTVSHEPRERRPVTLSAAKGLARRTPRSFAALRMTARIPLTGSLLSKCLSEPRRRLRFHSVPETSTNGRVSSRKLEFIDV